MSDSEQRVVIYTDGGASPNPGPGGWGAVLVHPGSGRERELSGGAPSATNNQMELTAAIEALDALKEPCRVDLFTDSQYLKKGITEWLPRWEARGWQRKGGEIKNLDLWQRLATAARRHRIRWRWVKGHAGNRLNEKADRLASREIAAQGGKVGASAGPARPLPPTDVDAFLKISCRGKRGAWAALVRQDDEEATLTGVEEGVTANKLYILAAVRVLEELPPNLSLTLHSACDYLQSGAREWLAGWRQRGWRTAEGSPVQNADAWRRLEGKLAGRRVVWPPPDGKSKDSAERYKALGKAAKAALG